MGRRAKPAKPELSALNDRFRRLMAGARKVRNLTQGAVAEKVGRPQSYLGKFEAGKRELTVAEFIEVAGAIGVSPLRIISRLLKRPSPTKAELPTDAARPPREEPRRSE